MELLVAILPLLVAASIATAIMAVAIWLLIPDSMIDSTWLDDGDDDADSES